MINYKDITGCNVFIDENIMPVKSLSYFINNMSDEEKIDKSGIEIITNDIQEPLNKLQFFWMDKDKKHYERELKTLRETAIIIENIIESNKVHA